MESDGHHAESQITSHTIEIKNVSTASRPGNRICGGPCGFADAKTTSGDAQERNASIRKLTIAVILCIIFMAVEVVGGFKANSLAILTDAAHLLSDVAAFLISLFSLWAASWEANPRQSYGFFRIEILGALVSIQLIWLLTGILVYEAILRLISNSGEVQGLWMFAVSAFGLVVNLVMVLLLGHDHGHGGHGHGHGHDHGDEHNHDDLDHDHNGAGHSHKHHDHTTHSHEYDVSVTTHDHQSLQQPFLKHSDEVGRHDDWDHDHDGAGHSHEHHAHTTHSHGYDVSVTTHDHQSLQQPFLKHSDEAGHRDNWDHDHDGAGHSHEHRAHTKHSHGCDVTVVTHDRQSLQQHTDSKNALKKKKQRNINVQGAYLHVLGDVIQSVGVMIGGAIIWYKPEWKIIDLICTLVFSVIVLGTTVNMIRNILEVLMESTPREIDATRLERGLCEIEGVTAVHELHIWAITVGKVLLACHVIVTREADPDHILDKVIGYIKREYNISHVTIQIERE